VWNARVGALRDGAAIGWHDGDGKPGGRVDVWSEDGHPLIGEVGEPVCARPTVALQATAGWRLAAAIDRKVSILRPSAYFA